VKKVQFLRDIDDHELFAREVENAYALAYEEIQTILARFPIVPPVQCIEERDDRGDDLLYHTADTYESLARMRFTMAQIIRDMADRRKRLADRTVGLTDAVFDEESS